MNSSRLVDLIEKFKYGQSNILDNGMKISYNPKTKQVKLDPFYSYDSRSTTGSCSELMNTAYLDISEKYPELYVTRVVGNDPNFFKGLDSSHCFLFVSEKDIMGGKHYIHKAKDIKKVISENPLVVDPSFNKVVPFLKSKYKVKRLINKKSKVAYSNTNIVGNGSGAPLGIDSHGRMVYLIVNFDFYHFMNIGIQDSGSRICLYPLNSDKLDYEYKDDSNILKFIHLFRKKKKYKVSHRFKVKDNIVIA